MRQVPVFPMDRQEKQPKWTCFDWLSCGACPPDLGFRNAIIIRLRLFGLKSMSHERRGSRRWLVPSERQKVAFKIGRKMIEGRLTDVSAGGFSVEVAADSSFESGTQVEMRTCDGTHTVQIAHVKREGNTICLGLERVRDVPLAEARVKKNRRLAHVGNPLFVVPVL